MKTTPFLSASADAVYSSGLRAMVWLNIVVQAVFPLALAFTPVMVSADTHRLPLSALPIQVYTLAAGETATSVARKYHLTLEQLRELNQFRTFSDGLNGLKAGDELDVPRSVMRNSTSAPASFSRSDSATTDAGDEQSRKVAGYTSRAGLFLAGRPNSDAMASTARGLATGEASSALQQWLSHFGTARVQLDADNHLSLKNSQFDLLLPLYDEEDNLAFTQGSLHHTDGRSQSNLGAGLRHFTSSSMLGGNLFGDYDLSRHHARIGAGLEYWRDFMQLSANSYLRLTHWKDAPELKDYQARPANGWDIRAQAWLPALPQLGGKVIYEQYYGKEVALAGTDNRRTNPHALTAGINYTPVPLITLGAEQRQGGVGRNDTRLTLALNYQPGVPWRSQIAPAAVAAMRTLAGSRYSLVERNNNIVLEYRKKELIRLHTADLITGYPGEQKSLQVSVNSTYGLARIDWDAAALNAAGGKIIQSGEDYQVVLPAWHASAQAVNTYLISGVALDSKGNRSRRSDTQVTVQAPAVNKQTSTFTPVSSTLPADGKSAQQLTLTLRDGNNQAVDLDVQAITLKSSPLKSAVVSALTRKSAGVYTLTVTAGTESETVTLTPSVNGITLSPAAVTISSLTPDATRSTFTASPETILADNNATSTLTLIAKDAQGNVLTGLKDSLTFVVKESHDQPPAAGVIAESAIMESSTKGTYTATLKGNTPDKYRVVPAYRGQAIGSLNATVTMTAIQPDEKYAAIKTDRTTYVTGDEIVLTVTLRDAQNQAITGASALLNADSVTVPNATLKPGSQWQEKGEGTYNATYIAGNVSADNQAALKLSGWSGSVTSDKYAITAASPALAQSSIARDRATYVAGEAMRMTVTLKDAQGSAVTGASALLSADAVTVPNATLKPGSQWQESSDGLYTATYIAGVVSAENQALLKLSGWAAASPSERYAITAGAPAQGKSVVTRDKAAYVAGEEMLLTVRLEDAQGNAVSGASDLLSGGAVTVPDAVPEPGSSWQDRGDGTYIAKYRAVTVSPDNRATLKLGEWATASQSEPYDIIAASPSQAQSAIARDKASYAAGEEMAITVTLKDAQGNAVTGASASLSADAVTVPNATLKPGSQWQESGDGIYRATYIAETLSAGNQATLRLAGWATASQSEPYDITAASPAQAQSAIARDKASYAAGEDIAITVTLKDAQGNAVTGASALLSADAVTVPNATLKPGSQWQESGDGTYRATYIAETLSAGNQATLRLAGWAAASPSERYDITAASPAQAQSAIARDRAAYLRGDDMVITVTLRDTWNNAVTGASALLSSDAVTVPNATLKTGSSWVDNGNGTYTATYTADVVSTDNQATLKLAGWSAASQSERYDIASPPPAQATSSIIRDKATYLAGDEMLITVTLRDAQSNAVTGASALLTADAVTVPDATLKSGSSWQESGEGVYRATYIAETVSSGNQATLKLSDWAAGVSSEAYDITEKSEAPASVNTQLDAYTFVVTSEEGTFPTTGFTGATFTLIPKNNVSASDYRWASDASWVSVSDGVVTFTGTGTGDRVTITGTPISGQGTTIKYSFRLNSWFINDQSSQMTWDQAEAWCSGQSGYALPLVSQMSLHAGYTATKARGTGALWNEWGNTMHYSGAGFFGSNYWSSEQESGGGHYYVDLEAGYIHSDIGSVTDIVVCRKPL